MPGQALPCEEGPARRPGLYSQKTLRQRRRNWKQVLWKTKKKKRKSLESVSKVVMVFLYIKTWLKIGVDHLHNEENAL